MKSFKQWLNEDYGERPKVKHIEHFKGNISNFHRFEVTHSSMKHPMHVSIDHDHLTGTSETSITNPNNKNKFKKGGSLGPAHNRYVLGRIRHHAPEVTHLSGVRATGARRRHWLKKDDDKAETHVKISHIKPISPGVGEE